MHFSSCRRSAALCLGSQLITFLLFVVTSTATVGEGSLPFRFTSDGLGFNVLGRANTQCNYSALPNITDYRGWPAGLANKGTNAFSGGVFDGKFIWLVPRDADQVVRIDPSTGNMTGYRDWPAGFTKSTGAFVGGVFDGTSIWLAPRAAEQVIRVNISTGNMTAHKNWPPGIAKGTAAFRGGVFDGKYIWLVPSDANQVVRIDPSTGNMTGYKTWPAGFSKSGGAFYSGLFDGKFIWLIPQDADRIIRLDPATGNMTGYRNWPTAGFTKTTGAFYSEVYDGASMWLVPHDADRVVRVDPASGNMTGYSNWPAGFTKQSQGFAGAVFDGTSVWMAPFDATQIVRLDTSTGNMTGYKNWPPGFSKSGSAFVGAVFDGMSIWLVPYSAGAVLRISLNCSSSNFTRTSTRTSTSSASASQVSQTKQNSTLSHFRENSPSSSGASHTRSPTRESRSETSTPLRWTGNGTPAPTPIPPLPGSQAPVVEEDLSQTLSLSSSSSSTQQQGSFSQTKRPIHEALSLVLDPLTSLLGSNGAKQVTAAAVGSVGLSSLVSSTATVTRAARIGVVARAANCAFVDSDTEPNYTDLPLQTTVGGGEFAAFAGSTLVSTAGLIVLPFGILSIVAVLGRQSTKLESPTLKRIQQKIVSNFSFMTLGFIAPNTFYPLILVAAHGGTAGEVVSVVVSSMLSAAVVGFVAVILLHRFDSWVAITRSKSDQEILIQNRHPHSMAVESFGTLFEGARAPEALIVRVYYLEELLVSIVLQCIGGIRPGSGECGPVAGSMTLVAALHLAYVVIVRPYADRLELLFAVLASVLLLALTLVAVVSTIAGHLPGILTALGVILLIQNVFFFVQLGVMAVAALMRMHRRRLELQWKSMDQAYKTEDEENLPTGPSSQGGPALEVPLLTTQLHMQDRDGVNPLPVPDAPSAGKSIQSNQLLNPLRK